MVLQQQVGGDQVLAGIVEHVDAAPGHLRGHLGEIGAGQVLEGHLRPGPGGLVERQHPVGLVAQVVADLDPDLVEGAQLAAHILAGGVGQSTEIGVEIGEIDVDIGHRQAGDGLVAAGADGLVPEVFLRGRHVLHREQAATFRPGHAFERGHHRLDRGDAPGGVEIRGEAQIGGLCHRGADAGQPEGQGVREHLAQIAHQSPAGPHQGGLQGIFGEEGRGGGHQAAPLLRHRIAEAKAVDIGALHRQQVVIGLQLTGIDGVPRRPAHLFDGGDDPPVRHG